MPNVSDDFVTEAVALAKLAEAGTITAEQEAVADPAIAEEKQAAEYRIMAKAELVSDTLVTHGVVEAQNKEAVLKRLLDHEETLSALNKTAQMVEASTLGAVVEENVEKSANADSMFLQALGIA